MACYNDVKTKYLPVTTGYQVSIAFSLIYDGPDKTTNTASLQQVRMTLENGELTIDQEIKSKPLLDKISGFLKSDPITNSQYPYFYMLNYSYSLPCVKMVQLKKSDKVLAKMFAKVAKEAGFNMYIGSIEREVEGKIYEDDKVPEVDSDCPMDEEGIFLTQSVNYDEYILTSLIDEQGKNVLLKPIAMDSKEHQPVIQGISWYAKCKPDSEEFSGTKKDVKYWYSNNTALVFIPKPCSLN